MSVTVALHHVTHYRYLKPINIGPQTIRLRPAPHARAHIQSYALKIFPSEHFINWQQDPFGNFLAKVNFPNKVDEFSIEVDLIVTISVFNPFDFFLEDDAKYYPFEYSPELKEALIPYLEIKEKGEGLTAWVNDFKHHSGEIIGFLVTLNQALNNKITYLSRLAEGVQSCEETLSIGSGSCRDMAWFFCQALRHLGLAARFTSGYLIQLKADVESLDGPSGTNADFTDLHAWVEVYLPGAGWVGLDATSGLFTGEEHIPLCCSPNPTSAAAVTGTIEAGAKATLTHEMTITRIFEPARVTKPYTEVTWQAIDALGMAVDNDLLKHDVRLAMGRTFTFVSLDDREHNAWQNTILGSNKKELALDFAARLAKNLSPQGLMMFGQGPSVAPGAANCWLNACLWRSDGEALWEDKQLLASPDKSLNHTVDTAQQFIATLAKTLGLSDSFILSAHEDSFAADRLDGDESDELSQTVGYVLPLTYCEQRKRWLSDNWPFAKANLALLAGDLPIGLRLPLGSLPQAQKTNHPPDNKPGKATSKALPSYLALQKNISTIRATDDHEVTTGKNGVIKRAITVEVRGGTLHLYIPPLDLLEHFLALLVAIEKTASALATPVVLAGYIPLNDSRLSHFVIKPEAGVLTLSTHFVSDWQALKIMTETVYAQARLARLSPEKFMLDGKHCGTGGGSQIHLGAMKQQDNPLLREPTLLASLIRFWQNHPSLSYLFSGQYIGASSNVCRMDEISNEAIYELDIALKQTSAESLEIVLAHLQALLGVNTQSTDICIDNLISIGSQPDRQKYLAMRGFEMSPHPQMNALQSLLLRALVALFFSQPYTEKMMRWGGQLHDKFMLPLYLRQDFDSVLQHLRLGGYPFSADWFEPFFSFRFVEYGQRKIAGIKLRLHAALEPWPVVTDVSASGATYQHFDTTVERLQLTVTGLQSPHHIVTCNGVQLPLAATASTDTFVAGIRFKAWQQAGSLHCHLPVNAPLVFEVYDTFNQHSLGGCRYHVAHPGGRNHTTFPVNANEAQSRRLARFESMNHTPGNMSVVPIKINDDCPHTLDLRSL